MADKEALELEVPLSFLEFEIYRYDLAAIPHLVGLGGLGMWFGDLASFQKCSKALERLSALIL